MPARKLRCREGGPRQAIDLCIQTNSRLSYYQALASNNVLRVDDTMRGPAAWARSLVALEEGDELPSVSF